ncbi:ABC transporter permease [Alteromonas flava]|uniref:ABC transporter permease n=1 Tax=Alteromonas flava TaxID=2048003 RepID=UPI001F0BE80E|nr:iron ABC transporter permease [Alteromonas flava]
MNRYTVSIGLIALALLAPLLIILGHLFFPDWQVWQHLVNTVLADYVSNSLGLAFGVALGTLLIGGSCAWLMATFEFPLRSISRVLLLLPLAMPAYISAYSYTGMLDVAGPVQTWIRQVFNWQYGDYWFPEVRSIPFAILLMSLVLYPYVYILARTAFAEQSARMFEIAQTHGYSRWRFFWLVSLPLARPALLTGAALAMMEVLADYGTVHYFGINTFTTGIFRAWYAMGNRSAAAQLAGLLCLFVLLVLVLEQYSRRKLKFFQSGQSSSAPSTRSKLKGWRAGAATIWILTPVVLGFILPTMQLLLWVFESWRGVDWQGYWELIVATFSVALLSAVLVVLLALLFTYQARWVASQLSVWQVRLLSLGYALPGMVIAIGALIVLGQLDHWLNDIWHAANGQFIGLVFSGSLFALVFCYAIRFLSVALQNSEAGAARIAPSIDDAALTLGQGRLRTFSKIHLPLMRASILSASLLVFVDVLKELPATLVLRPFNFNTLAVRAYEMASDERLYDAALPALTIVGVSLLPIFVLTRMLDKG